MDYNEIFIRYTDSEGKVNSLIFPEEHHEIAKFVYDELFECVLVDSVLMFMRYHSQQDSYLLGSGVL